MTIDQLTRIDDGVNQFHWELRVQNAVYDVLRYSEREDRNGLIDGRYYLSRETPLGGNKSLGSFRTLPATVKAIEKDLNPPGAAPLMHRKTTWGQKSRAVPSARPIQHSFDVIENRAWRAT